VPWQIFGAYLSDAPRPSTSFYGNGECFLWRAHLLTSLPELAANLPPPPSEDTTHAVRMTTVATSKKNGDTLSLPENGHADRSGSTTPERIRFKAFPYSGVNDYMIFCEHSYLSVGGGYVYGKSWESQMVADLFIATAITVYGSMITSKTASQTSVQLLATSRLATTERSSKSWAWSSGTLAHEEYLNPPFT